ncbi:hypothetical protein [Microbulbifer thermotolerans]|uniref:hypothetical protein n=1 Tax=Microbulbifer thermotolerans TaxID=252514 RepID=UPI00224A58FD|nr:hypothetical protein [Microbulbifer thermotolerans]MCX2779615.1 hypothetical protein [Microbulbifer thermotolerans]MCX2804954.1 hypothetical protein [Microbulbifer thermotolerans]
MEICRAISFIFCLLTAPATGAQTPEIQHQGKLRYVSGGIGINERRELEKLAADFDIKVILSTDTGHFLGGGQIKVRDETGALLLNTTSNGPIFLLDVPKGAYVIEAMIGDRAQAMRFETSDTSNPQSAYLTWRIDEPYRHYSDPAANAAL